jgi:hypothetical protein
MVLLLGLMSLFYFISISVYSPVHPSEISGSDTILKALIITSQAIVAQYTPPAKRKPVAMSVEASITF